VLKGQLDSSARLIWVLEKLRLATNVRWPDAGILDDPHLSGGRLLAPSGDWDSGNQAISPYHADLPARRP
jgi:hypothetical protein